MDRGARALEWGGCGVIDDEGDREEVIGLRESSRQIWGSEYESLQSGVCSAWKKWRNEVFLRYPSERYGSAYAEIKTNKTSALC